MRAMTAEQAGEHLAGRLGLPAPISAQQMWALARTAAIPCVRVGRRVWFQSSALDEFVRCGGTRTSEGHEKQQLDKPSA
jgi:hypothetical protein